jgi:hypothetical protein
MRKFFVGVVIFCIMLTATTAFAYRPFLTDSADISGKGVFIDEVGVDFLKWENKDTDTIISSFMFFGITKDLHVGVGVPYAFHSVYGGEKHGGFNDIYYYAKYVSIRDAKDAAVVSYKFQGKWNNGDYDKYLGFGDKEYQGSVILTQPVGDILQIHGQLAYNLVAEAKNPNYQNYISYGVAADYAYTKPTHFLFEVTGNQNPDKTLRDQKVGMIGVNYTLNDHYVVDASYRKGLTDTAQDYQVGVGVTIIY